MSIVKEIYLDHAATTYLDPRVKEAMEPYWEAEYGNPSSLYRVGRRAKDALDGARVSIAKILNCRPDEIIFTGGATASSNMLIYASLLVAYFPTTPMFTSSVHFSNFSTSVFHSLNFSPFEVGNLNLLQIVAPMPCASSVSGRR